jgi:alkanesulfonate monooxygenase SsuD/methylene tetrahydromethanopterin reductase-like flavin-dependent oxidoreductase (luciferase family)
MADYGHDLLFGWFLTPDAGQADALVALAEYADGLGLDLLGVQDHPYQPGFLDAWTLLATLAGRTERIRLFPNVANLPLRPPAVLARSAASLDILSGGRVELGLGAGFAWDAIAAMGGPRRSAGEAVDALAEAIEVIRALWTPGAEARVDGKHYALSGARPGPFPVHPVGIWIGSYKRRMLELTGRAADGWVPTLGYASPQELVGMGRTIDDAARAAGRDPAAIRRIYNVNGSFAGSGREFLQGPPAVWAEQLTELALELGISGFALAPGRDAAGDLRRFAEEVAPAVREAVAAARSAPTVERTPTLARVSGAPDAVPSIAPTPAPEVRLAGGDPLHEAGRPRAPRESGAVVTAQGQVGQRTLVAIHDHLRQELAQIRDAVQQVMAGTTGAAAARSLINQLTMRQNYWSLGAFCAAYCRVVSIHHTIEDEHMFVDLRRGDPRLGPVLDRLGEEHEVIAGVLARLDAALVAMVEAPERIADVRREVDLLTDSLLSHLAYEEAELLEPIGRLSLAI